MQAKKNNFHELQNKTYPQRRSMGSENPAAVIASINKLQQSQEAPEYKEVALNKRYSSTRHGRNVYVYPVELKKKDVVLKDNLNDKHSHTESRAKFDKFFVLDEE